MNTYARVRNADNKVLEYREHPDGHVETLAGKFGPQFAEQWLPVENPKDDVPGENQRLVKEIKVLSDKVTIRQAATDLSEDEIKASQMAVAGEVLRSDMSGLFTSMEKGTPPTADETRKILVFLLSQSGVA